MFKFAAISLTLFLGACASAPLEKLPIAHGPSPEIADSPFEAAFACVSESMKRSQRRKTFGVASLRDKTGRVSLSGDAAFGSFSTQGGSDMAISALHRARVTVIDVSPEFREYLDWHLAKEGVGLHGDGIKRTLDAGTDKESTIRHIPLVKGSLRQANYVVLGSISAFDFMPGDGVRVGVAGVSAGYNRNGVSVRIDLRLVEMPSGDHLGGRSVASVVVQKQILQDGFQVEIDRFFGPIAKPIYVSGLIGGQRRELVQSVEGDMIDLGVAALLAQVFKISHCDPRPLGDVVVAKG